MHARFHAPDLVRGGSLVQLSDDEARHLGRVLRLPVGATVQVFDGRGLEYRGRVASVERTRVTVALEQEVQPAAEPAVRLTLVQAVPKGDSMDEIVRNAVMLGVAAVVPLLSARSEVDPRRLAASGRVARWRRVAVASVKQCGRAVVPDVHEPCSLADCLRSFDAQQKYLFTEPGLAQAKPASVRDLFSFAVPASALLIVGPEGGWTEDEVRLATSEHCRPLTLGARTLRADAAALVGIAALQSVWGEFG